MCVCVSGCHPIRSARAKQQWSYRLVPAQVCVCVCVFVFPGSPTIWHISAVLTHHSVASYGLNKSSRLCLCLQCHTCALPAAWLRSFLDLMQLWCVVELFQRVTINFILMADNMTHYHFYPQATLILAIPWELDLQCVGCCGASLGTFCNHVVCEPY